MIAALSYKCEAFDLKNAHQFVIRDRNDPRHQAGPLGGRKRKPHSFASKNRPRPIGFTMPLESGFLKNLAERSLAGSFLDEKGNGFAQTRLGLAGRLATTGDIQFRCVCDVAGAFLPDLHT